MRILGRLTLVAYAAFLAACSSNSVGGNNGIAGPAPAIASITPSNSPPAGGGYALMKGFGFKTNATVQVGATYASFVTVVDAETLSFEIPAGVVGGANVVVTNSDGGKGTFTQGLTYVASTAAAPQVTKVTPNSGPITGGTYAQLNGQGFAAGAIVLVGGAPAPLVNVLAAGLITAIVPPHTGAGTANVVVTNPDGQSGLLSGGFAYSDLSASQGPSVTGVAPDEGPQAGGNSALIKVTNASANALLFIGGQPATYTVATGGLAAVMPAAAHHGLADVAVTNSNGQSGILPGAYNYIDSTLVAPPTIARIVPDQSPLAGGGRVVIDGSAFDPGAQVLFGDAPATGVVVANSNAITCLVPPNAAGPVDVTVQNSDGSLVTFAQGFTYAASALPAPTVTAVSPNTGPATGGTVAEIDGTNFVDGAVIIIGGSPADSVVLVNAGVMTGRFPPLPAGAADVTVTNPDGQSGTLASGFSVAATVAAGPPRVNGITPAAGPLQGGVSASVSGSGFTAGARVFIGGRPAPAALLAGALVVTVPAGAGPGLADVAVTNSDGQSDVLPGGFNYFNAPPVLIGISPTCGAATGATQVVIDGRNLEPGVSATIGGKPLTGLVRSDSATLTGTTAASPVGAADVQVVNPDGQTDTIAGGFYFTDQTHPCQATTQVSLSLTRVVPGTGPNTGGTVITLVGQGFLSGATVTFGGASASNVQLLGSGALTATLPAYSGLGPVNVAVALPDGRQAQLLGAFTYFDPSSLLPAPIVSAVSPSAGPNTGASVVEIDGENFVTGARVFFGGVEAQLPTLVSANQLIAVTPASLPGPVDVVVLNSDGKSGTLPDGFSYYPFGAAGAPPQAAQVSPRTGSTLTATQASVVGSGFQPGAEVFFGGAVATNVQIQSDGSLAVTIAPQPAGTVDVTVTNPDGQSSTIAQGFTFQPPAPQLNAIVPNDGPLAGGTTSVVSGAGFLPTDLIAFGGVTAAVKVLDDTAIFATVPAHAAGIVDVTLVRNSAVVSTLSAAYTYDPNYQSTPPPSIAALEPDTGPLSGGTVLWLTGANLVSGSKIYFGSNAAVAFVLADASHAVVTAPPGSAAGFVDVNIVNPNGQAGALLRGFSYVADANIPGLAPKLTSVTPATGPESSDTVAILTGNNFVNGEYVFVGAAQGAGVRLLSSSIIDNTFPHQPAGVVSVAVTDPTGRSSVLPNSFTFLARPTLQSVANSTPGTNAGASGPTVGGTPVTIAGTGFQNGATVTFGLVPATAVQVASSDVLTCVTPAGLAGPADVQLINPDGQTAVLSGGWLYVPPPSATGLTPPTGPLHGGTIAVLTGANFNPQATVTVGGVLANTLFGGPASVVVYIPAGVNAGAVDVVIKNPDGQTSTLHGGFTYSAGPFGSPPHISLIQPSSGPDTGGTMVVINGSNYQTGAIGIVGGNLLTRTLLVGPGAMTGFTAAAQSDGATLVAVTNPDGQSASLPTGFTYVNPSTLVSTPPPVVTGAVPSQALAPGGSSVSILGTGFSTGVVAPLVFLQGIPSNVSSGTTANQINVTTPAAQPGPADIVVVNPDGQTGIAAGAFTFLVPPPVFAAQNPLAPVKGPTAGGTVVVITGSYFQPPVQVFFGSSPGTVNTSAAATNANQITVTTPPGIAGNVAVLVKNKDGQSASLPGAFYYQPPPVLTSVTPPSGSPNGGNTVTLNGQYFSGSAAQMSVKFGAAAATISGTPTTNVVQVVVPSSTAAGALTVAVTVTNDDGQSVTVPGAYIYLPPPAPPQVLGVTPNAGSTTGGATVTVLGENFQFGARVFFGNNCSVTPNTCIEATSATVISDSAISCVVPAAPAAGTVGITVENPDTNQATLASSFTYVAGPPPAQLHVGSIVPNAGAIAGGTQVFIGGNGFENGATATLVPYDGSTCPGTACQLLDVTVLGPTAIEAVMPPQPVNSTALFNLIVANPGGASNELFKAYSYGNGTRHFKPTGLRLPLESHAGKYNRSISGRYAPAWSGVVGDFTRLTNPAGVSDVFIGAWAGRNPRLYQANFDPSLPANAKARIFTDLSSNLHNYDGTPMQDDCCGTTNNNVYYDVVEPRTADFDGNGQADVAFWNDAGYGFTIFWNQGGILTARAYGGGTPTDWQAFDWQGKLLDFNLDGSPDLLFVADNSPTYLMLGCGGTTPNPQGGTPLPKPAALGCILTSTGAGVNVAITAGSQTYHSNQNYNFSNTNFAQYMIPGTSRWIVDSGTNTEIVTISAATSTSFTATFAKAHVANTQWAPVINAVSNTSVATTGSPTVVTLNTIDGWGGACSIGLVVDPGTVNEERINGQGCPTTNYATKQVTLTFAKTHTAPFTITVQDPHTFAYDASRFQFGNGTLAYGYTYEAVASDIDGDGDIDVITTYLNTGLNVFLNNATQLIAQGQDPIGFAMVTSPTVNSSTFPGGIIGGDARALALLDAAGNGLPDLLVGYNNNQAEKLFMNQGSGVFVDQSQTGATKCVLGQPNRLPTPIQDDIVRYDVRDIDGNGTPDILAWVQVDSTANTFQEPLRLWLNDGHGCFVGQPTNYANNGITDTLFTAATPETWYYTLGDFNKDGLPDMIAGFDELPWREYVNTSGTFVDKTLSNLPASNSTDPSVSIKWWNYTMGSLLVDVNGDGYPDLVTSQFDETYQSYYNVYNPDGSIHVYLNDQQGNFPHDDTLTVFPTAVVPGSSPPQVVSALPIASFAMDSARLYPTGPMAIMITSNTIYSPASAIPSIFQGTPFYSQTGSHRLLIANNWTAANPYGNGTYSDQTYPLLPTNGETFTNANSVKFVDLDLDGYQDLVIGDSYTGNVMIWRGTASGNFIDVTSTAIPYGIQGSGGGETVRQILAAPLSESNLGLQDLFLVRTGGGSRILINHSDVQNHKILLVDETTTYTGQPNERLANPPNGISAVIANLDCTGGPDIYMLDDNGGEHFFSNSSCLQGGNCGFFTDLTNQTGVLPPQSLGSQCVGTDCGGNVKVLPINYDSGNTDLFIARSSAAWTVRPHRLLQNNCGSFTDVTLATWSPMPADDDALSLDGALIGDIFGHAQQGQTGNIQDLLILSNYAPRIYENTP